MKDQSGEPRTRADARRNTAIGFVVGMMFGGLIDVYTGDLGIASIIGMVVGSLVGYFGLGRVHFMEFPRGTLARLAIAVVIFVIVLSGTYYLLRLEMNQPLKLMLALAPAVAGFFVLISIANALSKLDELQRRIQVDAMAIGFGLSAIISLTYGLLGLIGIRQPNWTLMPAVMIFSWLIGKLWTQWKYR